MDLIFFPLLGLRTWDGPCPRPLPAFGGLRRTHDWEPTIRVSLVGGWRTWRRAAATGRPTDHLATQLKKVYRYLNRAQSCQLVGAPSCRSQAMYLFFNRLRFPVELHDLRVFWRIGAAQLIAHLADGEFIYFSHRKLLA